MKIKVTRTHHEKNKNINTWTNTNKDNIYQLIPPQGTSDIARGESMIYIHVCLCLEYFTDPGLSLKVKAMVQKKQSAVKNSQVRL